MTTPKTAGLPPLALHWLPVTSGGRRLTHGFVKREKPSRGWRSHCKRVLLETLAEAPRGASAPMCQDCRIEGDRALLAWKQRAGIPLPTAPESTPYSLAAPDPDDPDDDPYA